ncbi:hypothetical protein F3Y22_tig00112343pilonHSYRG00150 [Hibiscus syriacus]|uniref:Uncharacterized protein n=1 Tax=Hibiscus syriacus TaxID=106335 RepID=A0A6A2X127_HIBSY|nr:hypothetical protein F3Y22_tig00112343pilonHSYRG00150 [Hibiscus syriacus]
MRSRGADLSAITSLRKCKPKPRDWMYRMTSPQDPLMCLLSWLRLRSRLERHGENSSARGRELLDLIWISDTNSDASSDDGENASGPEDLFG